MEHSDLCKLVPEIADLFLVRFDILRTVSSNGPIGRRTISRLLSINERMVRNQTDALQKFNYIQVTDQGMYITESGKEILKASEEHARAFKKIDYIKKNLSNNLGVENIFIVDALVAGSFNEDFFASNASSYFLNEIEDGDIIGLTGGSTLKLVVDGIRDDKKFPNSLVVAARGSLGRRSEHQANFIVEMLADKLGSDYFLINFPDYIGSGFIRELEGDDEIRKYEDLIERISLLVFGVGRADLMAKKRRLDPDTLSLLSERGAVCEAFGNYFDIDGKSVHETDSIGLSLENYNKVKKAIAIAYGKEKAEAIISLSKVRRDIHLIIDFECAEEMRQILSKK